MAGCLAGRDPGPWADIERARLDELRQTAIEERIDVLLALGGHHQAVAELAALIREYPLRERFRGPADAGAVPVRPARRRAGRVRGRPPACWPGSSASTPARSCGACTSRSSPPTPPSTRRPSASGLAGPGPPVRRPPAQVPRELPGDATTFIGRTAELAELDRLLAADGERGREALVSAGPAAVVISAVAGSAGVGKTALAVHWGHRVRDAFPGGQLYVNLRGYDPGEPVTAADALARFLRSLGVADRGYPGRR